MQDRKEREIAGLELFGSLRPEAIRQVARLVDVVDVPAGHTLAERGQHAQEFVVIVGGTAGAVRGRTELVLGPGSCIGAAELSTGRRYASTIRARGPMRVLVVGRRSFRALLDEIPGVGHRLLAQVASRVSDRALYAEAS